MIDYTAFGKTMLKIFNCIGLFTDRIDRAVENIAMGGSATMFGNCIPVIKMYNKITDLTSKKQLLLNLRVTAVDILKVIDFESRKVLLLKYVYRHTAPEMAEIFKISKRTYFRRHDQALSSFVYLLRLSPLKEGEILECLQSEKWINELYLYYCQKNQEKLVNNSNSNNNNNNNNLEKFPTKKFIDKMLDLELARTRKVLVKSS